MQKKACRSPSCRTSNPFLQCKTKSIRRPRHQLGPVLKVVLRGRDRPRGARSDEQHAAALQGGVGQHERVS